jgi:RNA polymerase sigma-70 factor (ECF subfamily)
VSDNASVPDDPSRKVTDAVRALFVAHAVDLHAYATRRVGRDLADDVVAETFRQAIESWDRYDPSLGPARAWLFGIATNLLRRHWRTERRRLAALGRSGGEIRVTAADASAGVDDRLDAGARIARVLDAVTDLDPQDRELLTLVSWERMSHAEVAEVLSIPVGTVRSRLHRIRRRLEDATTPSTNDSKGDRT